MKKNEQVTDEHQLSLFDQRPSLIAESDWPASGRFPLNIPKRSTVNEQVSGDLQRSRFPLLITGYTALDQLIDLIGELSDEARIRIMIGSEPSPGRRHSTPVSQVGALPPEAKAYWLEQGISILSSGRLLRCIERLRNGQARARALPSRMFLHAKMYCGDDAVTVGSSNYSQAGLHSNIEANVRFTARQERRRFDDTWAVANNYWASGQDCSQELIDLLNELLQVVSWQEALARACVELLEGEWAKAYLDLPSLSAEESLWPSQRKGIAQAMYILSRQGSVLLADATGSGKTRLGVHLVRAVQDRIIRSGRLGRGNALMLCPPNVQSHWERESVYAGCRMGIRSQGVLSQKASARHDDTREAVRRAELLCVDEGHNFLNARSNRTRHLLGNMAEHVLLFTATPINRSIADLVHIVNLLGPDNFEDRTLKALRVLTRRPTSALLMEREELDRLRGEIQRFTVRRTKRMLNREIDRAPDAYTDRDGNRCRFPKHDPQLYKLNEPDADRALAGEIGDLAGRLYAVHYFREPLERSQALAAQGVDEESYLSRRCANTPRLLRHQVLSALRSSRAALAEHLLGTAEAKHRYGLATFHKGQATGDVFSSIQAAREAGPPTNRLSIDPPDWLRDPEGHREACDHDDRIYREIFERLKRMTDAREERKAEHLVALLGKESLVLAFDSHPITLADMATRIQARTSDVLVRQATGASKTGRQTVLDEFGLESTAAGVIGLCSDSLAEGVNLQRASTLVHLDMPTVVRIAEQRAGRVDRMDSPHKTIRVWWPDDAPEFAVKADEQFLLRYQAVDQLIGSNMPLPEGRLPAVDASRSARDLVKEYEEEPEAETWDGVHDAFQPVRDLIGSEGLVAEATYNAYQDVVTRVLSRVGLVQAKSPWAFFCIRAEPLGAPRWILLPRVDGEGITELGDVCAGLRARLGPEVADHKMDPDAEHWLDRFLRQLNTVERRLLSRRKQRALDEMDAIIAAFCDRAARDADSERGLFYQSLLNHLRSNDIASPPDWDSIASRWLEICRPVWYEILQSSRRQLLTLHDLRKTLIGREHDLYPTIAERFTSIPLVAPPDKRISACIIGIPSSL